MALLEWFLAKLPHESVAYRARTLFFVGLLLVSLPLLLVALLAWPLSPSWSILGLEVFLILLVVLLLVLMRAGHRDVAVGLYALATPLLLIARYFLVATDPLASHDPLYSDYLLVFALLNLVLITLVSSQSWHLALVWALYAVAGSVNLVFFLAPLNPAERQTEVLISVQSRYHLLLAVMAALLVILQIIIRGAVRQAEHAERRLEAKVDARTRSLLETQSRLERIHAALATDEKQLSLDRLMAGVAHEVNTPLGAIQASQVHLARRLPYLLMSWTGLVRRAPGELIHVALGIVKLAEYDANNIESRKVRKNRQLMQAWLEEKQIAQAEEFALLLADLGLSSLEEEWLTLFRAPEAKDLLTKMTELVEVERALSIIGTATTQAAAQIAALTKYSQPLREDNPVELVKICESLDQALSLLRDRFPRGVTVKTEFKKALHLAVTVQADRLLQVWVHLFTSSLQELGETGQVRVRVFEAQGQVRVELEDNGQGHRTGLEVVRSIVKDYGGTLEVISRAERTIFAVQLPQSDPPRG